MYKSNLQILGMYMLIRFASYLGEKDSCRKEFGNIILWRIHLKKLVAPCEQSPLYLRDGCEAKRHNSLALLHDLLSIMMPI